MRLPRLTRRRLVKALLFVALTFLAWQAASLFTVWKLTRRRVPMHPEPVVAIAGVLPEEVRLATSDGHECGAWLVRGRADLPVVVLLHGNGGSRASTLPVAELLVREGLGILAVTQRAHGDSTGDVNDFGWTAAGDVAAAVTFARRECPERAIVVRGSSLGAASAVFAADLFDIDADGYVLECPYRDLRTAVSNRTRMRLPPVIASIADLGFKWTTPLVLWYADMIRPVDAVRAIPDSVPILVLAGGADRHATVEEARDIVAAAGGHARLVVFEAAGHEGLMAADPDRYRTELLDFVRRSTR